MARARQVPVRPWGPQGGQPVALAVTSTAVEVWAGNEPRPRWALPLQAIGGVGSLVGLYGDATSRRWGSGLRTVSCSWRSSRRTARCAPSWAVRGTSGSGHDASSGRRSRRRRVPPPVAEPHDIVTRGPSRGTHRLFGPCGPRRGVIVPSTLQFPSEQFLPTPAWVSPSLPDGSPSPRWASRSRWPRTPTAGSFART
ncbi:hypothetical protein NKG05_05800 [Oerskovia sp. M15]